jgi:hypothetical protein
VMIKLARVQPLELGPPEESARPCNREEVLQRLETRAGPTRRRKSTTSLPGWRS